MPYIDLTPSAEFEYDHLSDKARAAVDRCLDYIERVGMRSQYVSKIRGEYDMYLARASNDIRIVLQKEGRHIIVVSIISRDKLHRMSGQYNWYKGGPK